MSTIRYPLFLLASLLLIAAGCSGDDDTPAMAPGTHPVDFSAISTRTTAADADDAGSFARYGTLHACISYDGKRHESVLTYSSVTSAWAINAPLCWQSATEEQTITLRRGSEGDFTLPGDMSAYTAPAEGGAPVLNYALHDRLYTTYTGRPAATPSWQLEHRMAQIRVELSQAPNTAMFTEADLARASVSMKLPVEGKFDATTGVVTQRRGSYATAAVKFYQPDASAPVFYAVALPGNTQTRNIEITITPSSGGTQTYRYTATHDIELAAEQCHNFALQLGAKVKPLSITTTGWKPAPVSPDIKENGGKLTLSGVTAGTLGKPLSEKGGYYDTISVAGSLNKADYTALNNFVNNIPLPVHLEIDAAGSSETVIPNEAFFENKRLTTVVLRGITKIGNRAFQYSALTSIELQAGLTTIGEDAFGVCTALTSIVIPTSAISWGRSVFSSCWNLTSVTLPEGLETISALAFASCSALERIKIPSSVTTVDEFAFSHSGLISIELPQKLTTIGRYAFQGCPLTSITIPSSVTTLDKNTFSYCVSLTTVTLSDGLKTIGESAFNYCTALEGIVIPSSVTALGQSALNSCMKLQKVALSGDKTIAVGTRAFNNTPATKQLFLYDPTADPSQWSNWASTPWSAIYHGFKGGTGDKLDPTNYNSIQQ